MNIYTIYCRMLILAGITLLVLVNLSQTAFAQPLERPELSDCIKRYTAENGNIIKFQNTCLESWTVKYFYPDKPNTPYERVLNSGESFIIHKKSEDGGLFYVRVRACPSTDDMSDFDSFNNYDLHFCAWR